MKYEVKIEDWAADLEIKIEAKDFDLISELQMAIESVVEAFHDAQEEEEDATIAELDKLDDDTEEGEEKDEEETEEVETEVKNMIVIISD